MAQQIQLRRGTLAEWTSANPILAEGEIGVELDTSKLKMGDGIQNYLALSYIGLGEINTASNLGSGEELFKQKTGSDLEFRTITSGSGISLATNTNDVEITVDPSGVDHDLLSNFVADEHINHSTVTITAGSGLSGGGDITASRTIDLDITDLVAETSIDNADLIAIYDSSATVHRKMTRANFLVGISANDERVKVSSNDTTAKYLEDSIVVSHGTNTSTVLELSTLNDGANEDLQIQFDVSKVVTQTITNGVTDKSPSEDALFDALALKQGLDTQLTSIAALAYTGNALKVVRVNAGETDFELATVSGGGGGYSVTSVTSTSSSPSDTSGERILLCDAATAGGNITVNIPTAVGNTAKFTIKKTDSGSNIVTIDPNSTETVDGFTTFVLYSQHDSITFISDNANWRII